jgi:hypothetical protein
MSQYEIDTTVELQCIFTNSLTGVYVDPTNVRVQVLDPTGSQTTQEWPVGSVIRDSLGHFHALVTPAISGNWTYKWRGMGAFTATSPDTIFTVNPTALTLIPHLLIFSIVPLSGPPGTLITINGIGFTGTTSVTINGMSASFTVVNDSTITATVP